MRIAIYSNRASEGICPMDVNEILVRIDPIVTALGWSTGGVLLLVGLVAGMVKLLGKHLLAKDVEAYKSQLVTTHITEVEQFKHDLQQQVLGREHRIAWLHEKRAEVIAAIFSALQKAETSARCLAGVDGSIEEKVAKVPEMRTALGELYQSYKGNEIYFSDEVIAKIQAFLDELVGAIGPLSYWFSYVGQAPEAPGKELHEAWFNAADIVRDKLPQLRANIRDEFRKLLGVIEEPHAK